MSFLGRLGRYGLNRVQPESVRKISLGSLLSGGRGALSALRPVQIDRDDAVSGFRGRYTDGGRARFSEILAESGLEPGDLEAIEAGHLRASSILFTAAAGFVFLAILLVLLGSGFLVLAGLIVCLLFMAGSLVLAVQSDFAAWQVRERRMAGLREYLATRFLSR